MLYKKKSTVPRFLLVLSYVFQSLSLVYLPNGPHLVPVLGLTTKMVETNKKKKKKRHTEHNKGHKQDTSATCPCTVVAVSQTVNLKIKKVKNIGD